jgi:hypothetical protein
MVTRLKPFPVLPDEEEDIRGGMPGIDPNEAEARRNYDQPSMRELPLPPTGDSDMEWPDDMIGPPEGWEEAKGDIVKSLMQARYANYVPPSPNTGSMHAGAVQDIQPESWSYAEPKYPGQAPWNPNSYAEQTPRPPRLLDTERRERQRYRMSADPHEEPLLNDIDDYREYVRDRQSDDSRDFVYYMDSGDEPITEQEIQSIVRGLRPSMSAEEMSRRIRPKLGMDRVDRLLDHTAAGMAQYNRGELPRRSLDDTLGQYLYPRR